jgi:DNA-binding transcriptional LysR family regulator
MDWDYFRYFLELARTGRLTSAARRLGVDQATVSRRVQNLEKQLGTTLFSRTSTGMEMTETAHHLMAHVESMEVAAARIAGISPPRADGLAGVVRVGATEGFGASILAPYLGTFASMHPGLTVDLIAVSAIVNISRREADIVISLERPKRGPFVVTRLCDYVLHIYTSDAYLTAHPALDCIDDLKHHTLIGYMDDLIFSNQLLFFNELEAPQRFSLRSTSVMAQISATASGAGLAILPAFLADRDPRLRPVLKNEVRLVRTFWMSMPEEVRQLPRMRATWDFIRQAVESERSTLLSDGASAP